MSLRCQIEDGRPRDAHVFHSYTWLVMLAQFHHTRTIALCSSVCAANKLKKISFFFYFNQARMAIIFIGKVLVNACSMLNKLSGHFSILTTNRRI